MRHDWMFEVLADLRSYAQQNGLLGLAVKVDEALAVARAEAGGEPRAAPRVSPSGGRAN